MGLNSSLHKQAVNHATQTNSLMLTPAMLVFQAQAVGSRSAGTPVAGQPSSSHTSGQVCVSGLSPASTPETLQTSFMRLCGQAIA